MVVPEEITIDWFVGLAIGLLNMKPEEFFEMRLKFFFLKLQEYNRNAEAEIKFQTELLRLQTTSIINSNRTEDKQLKPGQVWKLPWDKEAEVEKELEELTAEEFNEAYKNFVLKDGR